MRFLVLVTGITALFFTVQAVAQGKKLTLDSIKDKARQLYKQIDTDKDGHISYDELSAAFKKGIGLKEDDVASGYVSQFYEKYLQSDKDKENRKHFTEEDFEEFFRENFNKDASSTIVKLKQKANELYEKFDANGDGHLTLEQIGAGLKSGVGFGQKQQDKSLRDYANQLYQKYIESERDKTKSFTRKDFYNLLGDMYEKYKEQGKQKINDWGVILKDVYNYVIDKLKMTKDTLSEKAVQVKDAVVQSMETQGTTLNKLKQTANAVKDKVMHELDTQNQDSTINKLKQTAGAVKDKVLEELDTEKQDSTINKIKQTAQSVGEKVKDKVLEETDLENPESTLSKLKDTASNIKDKVLEQLDTEKEDSAINKLKQGAKVVGGKVMEELDLSKEDSTINKVKDAATVVKDKILEELDLQNDDSTLSHLRDKANEVYKKIDTNNDDSISLEELKEGLKAGLTFGKDAAKESAKDVKQSAEEKGKQLSDKATQLYQKYIKYDNRGANSLNKENFFKLFVETHRDKNSNEYLERAKKKANEIYKKFDKNEDGKVTLEELGAGIKQGLGLEDSNNIQKGQNIFTSLYEKLTNSSQQQANRSITQDDFLAVLRKNQFKGRKADCNKTNSWSLDQFKDKVNKIYEKYDTDKDEHLSFGEITQGIKNKLGFQSDVDEDQNSWYNYAKQYYDKLVGKGEKEKVKISKDDFTGLYNEWKRDCPKNQTENSTDKIANQGKTVPQEEL